MECYTPATTLQHAPRTAELAEFPISIATVLATLRAFDAEKCSSLGTKNYFMPVSYSYQPPIFDLLAPVEAAHVGGGASFMPYQYMYTRELI